MRRHLFILFLLLAVPLVAGCANFIKEDTSVVWGFVPNTEDLLVEDSRLTGATLETRVRFVSQRQQHNATQISETPHRILHELYEVPVGAITIVPALAFFVVVEVVTLTGAESSFSRGPLDWSAAGLNPFLPVERGMFAERVRVREVKRTPTRSSPEGFSESVGSATGRAEVRFSVPGGRSGDWREVTVGRDLLVGVNLLEASPAMPAATATRVEVRLPVAPSGASEPLVRGYTAFIPQRLAQRLFEARDEVTALQRARGGEREGAAERLRARGFGAEVERLLDLR